MKLMIRISFTVVLLMVFTASGVQRMRAQSTATPSPAQAPENKPADSLVQTKIQSTI
jgi:hypothetical protein